ncbi:MAG: hypothetical protein KKI02_07015 [Planctomycetes bacterium]|nr:hypothetical protein [Planctomycetota bacterium]
MWFVGLKFRQAALFAFMALLGFLSSGETYATAEAWSLQRLSELRGPIDKALPAFGEVQSVRVCGGDAGRVGVAWIRGVAFKQLRWDDKEAVWRVRGSDKTLQPVGSETLTASLLAPVGGPLPPDITGLYETGNVLGMSILGPEGVLGAGFQQSVEPGLGPLDDRLGSIAFSAGKWYALLTQWPAGDTEDPSTHGLAIAAFDEAGWQQLSMAVPGESPSATWIFVYEEVQHLFWLKYYTRQHDLPDFMGGIQRQCLEYARMQGGKPVGRKTVYDRPNRPKCIDELSHQVLPMSAERYDLLMLRDTNTVVGDSSRQDVMHVPDLLGQRPAKAKRVGDCEIGSMMLGIPLSDRGLVALWLEEVQPGVEQRQAPIYRLVESRLEGGSWSQPTLLFQEADWCCESLAAACFQSAGGKHILAVWRGHDGRLTYSVSSAPRQWSAPQTTSLVVGRRNWLVAHDDDSFTLVTAMDRNLFWCTFGVVKEEEAEKAGADSR